MDKSYWQVLPNILIDKIEEICRENQDDSSTESMIGDLQEFVSSQILKDLNVGIATALKSKIDVLKPDKLNRALNRRSDNGVFIKDGNKKLLNFLCYYAYKMNWRDTLAFLEMDEELLEKRIVSKKVISKIEQNKSHIAVKIYKEQKQTLKYVKKIENNINTLEYDEISKLYTVGTKVALSLNDEYGTATLNKLYAEYLIKINESIDKAKMLLEHCLRVYIAIGYPEAEDHIKERLAEVEILLGNYIAAELYISDYINSTIDKTPYQYALGYFTAANISQNLGDYTQREKYLIKVKVLALNMLESKDEKQKIEGRYFLNNINYAKGLYKKQEGLLDEAKGYFEKICDTALTKDEINIRVNSLFRLSEIEIINGNWSSGKWLEYLLKIKTIAIENKEFYLLAMTICHIAKLSIDRNEIEIAIEILEAGLTEIIATKNSRALNYYQSIYVQVFVLKNDYEKAEASLVQYLQYIEGKGQQKNEIHSLWNLLNIQVATGNEVKKQNYIDILLQKYNSRMLEEISDYEKGEYYVAIGDLQLTNKNYAESKISYANGIKVFKRIQNIEQEAEALLKLMECENDLKNFNVAYKIALDVVELVKDTNFQLSYFKGCMYCASYHFENDISQAESYLEEANNLDKKYKFQQHNQIFDMLGYLAEQKKQNSLSKISLKDMISRLYEGITSKKSRPESVIRFWYYKYRNELYSEIKNRTGLKAVIFNDNLEMIIYLRNGLSWLFQWFSIISNNQFEEKGIEDKFLYPFNEVDKDEMCGLGLSMKGDNLSPRLSNEERLKINTSQILRPYNRAPLYWINFTKDIKTQRYISGVKYCLPKIAYELVDYYMEQNVLLEENMLVDPFETKNNMDKVQNEINYCISIGSFPIYVNIPPQNNTITIISSQTIHIPFGNEIQNEVGFILKKAFNLLNSLTNENINFIMNSIKLEFENACRVNTHHVLMDILIAVLPETNSKKKKYWPIFVLHLNL